MKTKKVPAYRTSRLRVKVNPAYKKLLSYITTHYKLKDESELVDTIVTGKALVLRTSDKTIDQKMNRAISTNSTQSIDIFNQLIGKALSGESILAAKEFESFKEKAAKIGLKSQIDFDYYDICDKQVNILGDLISTYLKSFVKFHEDKSKLAETFRSRLKTIDINENLPKKINLCTRHTKSTYAKNFNNDFKFKAGEKPDSYNRRALHTILSTKSEFLVEEVTSEGDEFIQGILNEWNNVIKKYNTSLLKNDATGIWEFFVVIFALRKKINDHKV